MSQQSRKLGSNPLREAIRMKRKRMDEFSNLPRLRRQPEERHPAARHQLPPPTPRNPHILTGAKNPPPLKEHRDHLGKEKMVPSEKTTRPVRVPLYSERHLPVMHPMDGDSLPPWSSDIGVFRGAEFIKHPGVLNTDSADVPGVASRMMFASILPRDEETYFARPEDMYDQTEIGAFKVMQQLAVTLAKARHDTLRLEQEIKQNETTRNEIASLHGLVNQLQDQVKLLESEKKDLHKDLFRMKVDCNTLTEEKSKLSEKCAQFSTLEAKHNEVLLKLGELEEKCANHKSDVDPHIIEKASTFDSVFAEKEALQKELKTLKEQYEEEKHSSVEAAVRDYRESVECFNAKAVYGAGFYKAGFYTTRRWLEKVKGQTFPDMIFTDEIEDEEFPDWRIYDPQEKKSFGDCMAKLSHDNLKNLSGPWEFFGNNGVDKNYVFEELIPALQDLDEVYFDDLMEPTDGDELILSQRFLLKWAHQTWSSSYHVLIED